MDLKAEIKALSLDLGLETGIWASVLEFRQNFAKRFKNLAEFESRPQGKGGWMEEKEKRRGRNLTICETRPDTWQSSRGRLGTGQKQ